MIIGLGYVGLPVAARFAQAGFRVTGLDIQADKAAAINAGDCPIEGEEPGLSELVAKVVTSGGLQATTDYAVCQEADVILVAVGTPIACISRVIALRAALRSLEPHL